MRRMLVTVRWPGTRMAPSSSTWACRQVCWRKSGAKHRITAAKRAGRRSMVAVLWLGRSSLAAHPLRRPSPGNGQSRAQFGFGHLCGVAERMDDAVAEGWAEFRRLGGVPGREETLLAPELAPNRGERVGE